MKKTVWYIRQWPSEVVGINLVESYDPQLDGVHIKYIERDINELYDPLWRESLEAVVHMSDLAFSYTEAVNKLRDILKDFNSRNEEHEPVNEEWNDND